MDNSKTGGLIRERRKEMGLTQATLAERLHITDRAVSKWERGLCAPDIAMLEPLAAVLKISVMELISGERAAAEVPETVAHSVEQIIRYSEKALDQRAKSLKRKMLAWCTVVCLLLVLLVPTVGTVGGDGFSWGCIPAYVTAREAATALQSGNAAAIEAHISHADGLSDGLAQLQEQGVLLTEATALLSRIRLEDRFLILEIDLLVQHRDSDYAMGYMFTCTGTYREGKVELMGIVSPNVGQEFPAWVLTLNNVLSTYTPG